MVPVVVVTIAIGGAACIAYAVYKIVLPALDHFLDTIGR